MSTFLELQKRVVAAQSKAVIYQHLIDHLEANFRPIAGAPPKKVMLTSEKVPVAEEFLDQVVKELFSGLETVNKEIEQVLSMPLLVPGGLVTPPGPLAVPPGVSPVAVVAAPVPAPVPVVAPDLKKKSGKSTTQGEVQS